MLDPGSPNGLAGAASAAEEAACSRSQLKGRVVNSEGGRDAMMMRHCPDLKILWCFLKFHSYLNCCVNLVTLRLPNQDEYLFRHPATYAVLGPLHSLCTQNVCQQSPPYIGQKHAVAGKSSQNRLGKASQIHALHWAEKGLQLLSAGIATVHFVWP